MPAKRRSGRSGNSSFRKRSRRQPVASRGRKGDGILNFRPKDISLCLCGKGFLNSVNHRDTDVQRGFTEKIRLALIVAVVVLVGVTSSCSRPSTEQALQTQTREVTYEAARRVRLPDKIDRIVSLAPNLTEIVYAVGAGDQLVGDTEYCDYPFQARSVAKVGDTMHPSIERIIALKPQIVLVSTASQ